MKRIVPLLLVFCVCLIGCSFLGEGSASGEQNTASDIAVRAAEEKAAYYASLVEQLQEELLNLKVQYHMDKEAYEARIEELENAKPPQEEDDVLAGQTPDASRSPFLYKIENGSATILKYTGRETVVTIPETIEGAPVTAIADRAFENQFTVTAVSVPKGVKTLGWFSFSGCISLRSVTLPKSVESISYGAFQNCPSSLTLTCDRASYADRYAESYGLAVIYTD